VKLKLAAEPAKAAENVSMEGFARSAAKLN